MGDTALHIVPVSRQILIGVTEGMGSFDPDLFALQGTLKLLQHTQFVIVAVNFGFAHGGGEKFDAGPGTEGNAATGKAVRSTVSF